MSNAKAPSRETTIRVRDTCLCLHLQRAARAVAREFDEAFRPFGLTNGQFSLVLALNRPDPPTSGDVARLLAMDRTTLTAALKPLQRRGLVRVTVDRADRRVRRPELTSSGRALLLATIPVWQSEHAAIERRLGTDPDRLRAALEVLSAKKSRASKPAIDQAEADPANIDGPSPMPPREVVSELAPTGVLRAAINIGNFLLVTGRSAAGDPEGVAPDLAREIAGRLGVPVAYLPYARPGELADAAGNDVWDIGLIGAEPQRAEKIAFSPAYVEIEATYLVPAGSALALVAEVDRPGVRIAVAARSAYDLWLARNIKAAQLVRSEGGGDAAFTAFVDGKLEALAGLRPGLLGYRDRLPGSRILDGQFTAVQQAVGTARANQASAAFLRDFVEEAKQSGLVARLIERHGVVGRLSVAPPA